MKTHFFLFFVQLFFLYSYGQNTYVPDDNFENYLETHNAAGEEVTIGNSNSMGNGIANDNYVLSNRIASVVNLQVNNQNISDLTGIEDFTSLVVLRCEFNSLSNLNLNQNTQLQHLYCYNNNLSSLDLSQNNNLIVISCSNNLLTNISLDSSPYLRYFFANNNLLSDIDVSSNTLLERLQVSENNLTHLNVISNSNLIMLRCAGNLLTELNTTNNPNLGEIDCSGNQISQLDLTNNTHLVFFYALYNRLERINLSSHPDLLEIGLSNNSLNYLNIRNGANYNLWHFEAYNNENLNCIIVDDIAYSQTNFTLVNSSVTFVENESDCNSLNIEDGNINSELIILNNPIKNKTLKIKTNQAVFMTIYSTNGKFISKYNVSKGEHSIKMGVASGIYFIKVNFLEKNTKRFYKIIIN